MNAAAPIIDIRNLTVTFTAGRKPVQAVNGVDLSVAKGEVLALLGESGSGKSVTLRTLLRLHSAKKTRIAGHVRSEEHTSELQSLMRISYAVFCSKKKINNKIMINITNLTA